MDPTVHAIAGLTFSVVAILCAAAALVRISSIAKITAGLSASVAKRDDVDQVRRDLLVRISEIEDQFEMVARQLDALQLSVSELDLARREAALNTATASAAQPSPAMGRAPLFRPLTGSEPETEQPPVHAPAAVSSPASADPSAGAPERLMQNLVDELVAGYRSKIAERSKAPIREWLSQHNSFTLDAAEDGSLIPSESGVIAAIPIGDGIAMLVPTASFVVDFATRFAGSQISLRQVMRNTFDAVADNSGDMKLQAPAMARRAGERWIVEKPGRLGGFTDN